MWEFISLWDGGKACNLLSFFVPIQDLEARHDPLNLSSTMIHDFEFHEFWSLLLSCHLLNKKSLPNCWDLTGGAASLLKSWQLRTHKQESLVPPSMGILLNALKWEKNIFPPYAIPIIVNHWQSTWRKQSLTASFLVGIRRDKLNSVCLYIKATGSPSTCEVLALTLTLNIKCQLPDRLAKAKFKVMCCSHYSKIAVS